MKLRNLRTSGPKSYIPSGESKSERKRDITSGGENKIRYREGKRKTGEVEGDQKEMWKEMKRDRKRVEGTAVKRRRKGMDKKVLEYGKENREDNSSEEREEGRKIK